MKYMKFLIGVLFSIPLCLNAQECIKDHIGQIFISKHRCLIFSGYKGTDIKDLEGNKEFICIGESNDIYGNKCGVFQATNDATNVFRSPWNTNTFDYFITKSEYNRLCKEYGQKQTVRALNGEVYRGMYIALFIIAHGTPSSTRTIDTKYGHTTILSYDTLGGYDNYIFKNNRLDSTDEWN